MTNRSLFPQGRGSRVVRWLKAGAFISGAVTLTLGLSGCTTSASLSYGFFGPRAPVTPTIDEVQKQAMEIAAKVTAAGGAVDYVQAGYYTVDKACDAYFDNLTLIQNQTRFTGDSVTAAGTAASATEALRKNTAVAARQLARIAAGTALTSSVISAFDNRALMTPYASETKTLIVEALYAFRRDNPASAVQSRAEAALVVERYAEICTYSGITRYAKLALTRAPSDPSKTPSATPTTLSSLEDAAAISISYLLGATDKRLTDRQLAIVGYYVNVKPDAYKSAGAAVSLLKELPASVQAQLAPAGKPADPTTDAKAKDAAAKAGPILAQLSDSNAAFKGLIEQVGREYDTAAAAEKKAVAAGQQVETVLSPAPKTSTPQPAAPPVVARPVRLQ